MQKPTFSFHLIGHQIKSEIGHHLTYVLGLEKALSQLGPVHIYVPRNADVSLPEKCVRWFHSFHMGDRLRFWNDCRRLFTKGHANRVFFIESFGRRDIRLFMFAARLFAKKNDFLWLILRDDLTSRNRKDLNSIRFTLQQLARTFQKRLVLMSDSENLIDFYKPWFSQPIFLLPIFHAPYSDSKREEKDTIICSWVGDPRPEKGMAIIQKLLKSHDPACVQFELLLSESAVFSHTSEMRVTPLKKVLTHEEYDNVIKKSDVILLPYHTHRYKMRSSGIFVEAILAGKMPLVTPQTWMACELEKYDLTELVLDWEEPYFFSKIKRLYHDVEIHHKLRAMQLAYREFHCFEKFSEILAKVFDYALKESRNNC